MSPSPAPEIVDGDVAFPEGPFWHEGRLAYVDFARHQVLVLEGGRKRVLWERDGSGPCGLAPAPGGGLLVACYDGNAIAHLAADGRLLSYVTKDDAGGPMIGCNDLIADRAGGAYFTASGVGDPAAPATGMVFHRAGDGRIARVAAGLHYANGLALLDGGRTLVVSEHLSRRLTAFPVKDDGGLGPARPFCRLDDLAARVPETDAWTGGDGIELDAKGRLHICEYGAARMLVCDEKAKPLGTVPVPAKHITNVAFAPDGAAYVTAVFDGLNPPFKGVLYRLEPGYLT